MRFAYLIMAHHKFDVLELLLKDLDDNRNDIFLHIDKKCKDFNKHRLEKCVTKANLIFIKRISVFWSDYSQIECILSLLKAATAEYHDYYHFLVGVEFPIKTQNQIYDFFEYNCGKEFVGFDDDQNFLSRIRYYHIFSKYARSEKKYQQLLYGIGKKIVKFQKKHNFNRIKCGDAYYKKGYANWSITHNLALLFLNEGKKAKKTYNYSSCADEVIFHTILFHSQYYSNVYDIYDEYNSAMRLTTWEDPKNQFHKSDIDKILSSGKLFARKFDSDDATAIINEIVLKR